MRISAWIAVYNEEKRIRYTLESVKWCDEIFVVDKTSTDNTVEICKEYGAEVNIIPNSGTYDPREFEFLNQCTGDWIIIMTASDIIDKSLAEEIKHQIDILPNEIKCINVPFRNYILGINHPRSPWYDTHRLKVFRKGNYKIKNDVHGAFSIIDHTAYTIPEKFGYFSHLTHVTVDMLLDRHTRYWRGEGLMYDNDTLLPAYNDVVTAIEETLQKRQTYKIGWDGMALTMAYVSYYMFSFLYKWEHLNKSKAQNIYSKLRKDNYSVWRNENVENNPVETESSLGIPESDFNSHEESLPLFDFLYFINKRRIFKVLLLFSLNTIKVIDKILIRIYK